MRAGQHFVMLWHYPSGDDCVEMDGGRGEGKGGELASCGTSR
jgi:hypothetical protein